MLMTLSTVYPPADRLSPGPSATSLFVLIALICPYQLVDKCYYLLGRYTVHVYRVSAPLPIEST